MDKENEKVQTPGASETPETPPEKQGESDPKEPNWLPERLERAKRSAVSELMRELGVQNADALKKSLADWKKHQDEQKSDLEKANDALTQAKAELAQMQAMAWRAKAAAKYKLPEALVNRLQGETEEAIEADAKALSETLPKPGASGGSAGGTSPGNPASTPTLTRDDIARMTTEQINARWDEVQRVLGASKK